jgi:hypothetical protein
LTIIARHCVECAGSRHTPYYATVNALRLYHRAPVDQISKD